MLKNRKKPNILIDENIKNIVDNILLKTKKFCEDLNFSIPQIYFVPYIIIQDNNVQVLGTFEKDIPLEYYSFIFTKNDKEEIYISLYDSLTQKLLSEKIMLFFIISSIKKYYLLNNYNKNKLSNNKLDYIYNKIEIEADAYAIAYLNYFYTTNNILEISDYDSYLCKLGLFDGGERGQLASKFTLEDFLPYKEKRKNNYILISNVDDNWGIGYNNDLLIHSKKDMAFFKGKTINNIVVMGRKTFESIPGNKGLKHRINIILTKSNDLISTNNYYVVHSEFELEELLQKINSNNKKEVFIIGGEQIYKMFLNKCSKAYITKTHIKNAMANKFFPNLDLNPNWECVDCSKQFIEKIDNKDINYQFTIWENNNNISINKCIK